MRMRITVPSAEPILTMDAEEAGAGSKAESDIEIRILALLKKETLPKSEIAKRLGKGKPCIYLNSIIRKLIGTGKLESMPEKPNSRLQKYRLADKGRHWLQVRDGK